ncbi:MAG: hypothetical protein EBQ80_03785 [Proteobacteria bacterium]|nr:hypothetical protein [Pseudomonadota bacterium]
MVWADFGRIFGSGRRGLEDLGEREILALAIGAEEEDGRIYRDMAAAVRADFAASAKVFEGMAAEEDEHRQRLIDVFVACFGQHIPLVRREDVAGFIRPAPIWRGGALGDVRALWQLAEQMEGQAARFYGAAAARCTDAATRKLLGDLAAAEASHGGVARGLQAEHLGGSAKGEEARAAQRQVVLQIVQPGLAGLMDGSVSTLAPLFAAAFASQDSHTALMVGLAASVGAGISMGLTEAFSDDGKISGRGSPWLRGGVCGLMTTVGGLGHTLPYLLHDFWVATALAVLVVVVELLAIAWIRWKYMESPFWVTVVQVLVGGALVLAAGVFLGSA